VLRRPARPCGARLRGHQRPHHATPQASRRRRHALPQAPHPEAPRSPRGPRVGRHAVPIGARRGPSVRRRHPAVRASAEEAVLRQHLRRHGDVTGGGLAYKGRSDRTHSSRRLPHCPPSAAIRSHRRNLCSAHRQRRASRLTLSLAHTRHPQPVHRPTRAAQSPERVLQRPVPVGATAPPRRSRLAPLFGH
jgi:hypothetical protein